MQKISRISLKKESRYVQLQVPIMQQQSSEFSSISSIRIKTA